MRNAVKNIEPRIIKGSRGKTLLYLTSNLVFVLGGAFLIRVSTSHTIGLWWCVAFFGLCALVFAWLLVRPQTLMLDGGGFTVGGGLVRSPKQVPWKDVQGFLVYSLPKGGKLVGYNFQPGTREETTLIRMNRSLGAEAALPKGFPLSAEKMAELLNDYRLQALAR